nr:MAG TPA: hypothetical protein [Bacteriophage sp.]DAJ69636.1 MAG TPA: hypothetical protein [Caudoviricetes sp.]
MILFFYIKIRQTKVIICLMATIIYFILITN